MSLEHLWAGWRAAYIESTVVPKPPDAQCLFCALQAMPDDEAMILERTQHTFTVMNAYPYTSGHVMTAPLRHVGTIATLDPDEAAALMHAAQRAVVALESAYQPEGINVGVNLGRPAGGSVSEHLHVHVVPRWTGDGNFMTATANTRTLPEALPDSAAKIRAAWG